jgi:hypothetical protein
LVREAFDDGWTADDEAPAQLKTHVTPERSKTIIARNDSPDIGFDRSINPYRGCEHGCIYWAVTHLLWLPLCRHSTQVTSAVGEPSAAP